MGPDHRAIQGLLRALTAPARAVVRLCHRKSLQRHATGVSFSRSNGGVSHLSCTPFAGVRCAMLGAQILGCLPALGPLSHGGLAIARTENAMRGVRRKVKMPKEALGVIRARSMPRGGPTKYHEVSRSSIPRAATPPRQNANRNGSSELAAERRGAGSTISIPSCEDLYHVLVRLSQNGCAVIA